MITGPYLAGARTESERAANHRLLNEAAGRDRFDDIMMPVSLAAAQRCDACLRLAGPSSGADQEVQVFRKRGLPVFLSIDEIPKGANEAEECATW